MTTPGVTGHRLAAPSPGNPPPILAGYGSPPQLRQGVAWERWPQIEPLSPELDPSWFEDSAEG